MTANWSILNTIKWLTEYFEKKDIPEARLNAEHLIAHTLGIGRLEIYLKFEYILTKDELSNLRKLIERRASREPLQHILGTQPFRKIDIKVNKHVLIPRPETEVVVTEALNKISEGSNMNILELGVGSGAILAALASERANVQITGTEISSEAIDVAKENTKLFSERINLLHGDLFGPLNSRKFDLIISNPPYIPSSVWEGLDPEVRDWEPKTALIAGKDGLDFYRRILNDAPNHLNPGGWLIFELGDKQSEQVVEIANNKRSFSDIEIKRDLSNKDRIFIARYNGG